ncbi:conserved hypothetical protein [Candida dubliniensis CD36]|uniref:Uncharacterized protein n=1 Tax=Candida dubliniensis (strain CD36 / ATCC MYA-646 / CBS 7987 / NCPF 3949 / NRRL Y-17841) TaxID=573826 RepID=B9WN32_CANDC|nr:conserved hypothetical protein [Candida dubliniensis CD36]CAX40499.1 conserved hypothetical protein [Candida dubliniensis CD36]
MKFQFVTALAFVSTMVVAAPINDQQEVAGAIAATRSKRAGGSTGAELQDNNQATAGLFGDGNSFGNQGLGGFLAATVDSLTKAIASPIKGILAPGGNSGAGGNLLSGILGGL